MRTSKSYERASAKALTTISEAAVKMAWQFRGPMSETAVFRLLSAAVWCAEATSRKCAAWDGLRYARWFEEKASMLCKRNGYLNASWGTAKPQICLTCSVPGSVWYACAVY